jgi:hypothetical protein
LITKLAKIRPFFVEKGRNMAGKNCLIETKLNLSIGSK